jgi:hypothetical protein
MRGVMPLPLWVIALVLAAIAPLVARALASAFERRARTRGKRVLERRRREG